MNFRTFFETLTTSQAFTWLNDVEAKFTIDDKEYQVTFASMDHLGAMSGFKREWRVDDYHVDFCLWNDDGYCETDITGTGDAFAVFATVVGIIKEFCNKHSWKSLYFTAAEPNRQQLYVSLVRRFAKQGYPNTRDGKYFIIENPKYEEQRARRPIVRKRSPDEDKWAPSF